MLVEQTEKQLEEAQAKLEALEKELESLPVRLIAGGADYTDLTMRGYLLPSQIAAARVEVMRAEQEYRGAWLESMKPSLEEARQGYQEIKQRHDENTKLLNESQRRLTYLEQNYRDGQYTYRNLNAKIADALLEQEATIAQQMPPAVRAIYNRQTGRNRR